MSLRAISDLHVAFEENRGACARAVAGVRG